ncbi:hypothetical protein EVA_13957 [gut metagenome]|uniref:ATP-grasp domain-containing protein n=1 Tax=gut metagenome TaxID=749906 RepID=J9FTT0_9ZZZZ
MKLHIFNPEADLALADFSENYMASARIRRMAADLAVLPLWWAGEGDGVVAASAYNQPFAERMNRLFGRQVTLVTPPELAEIAGAAYCPWGWNPALRKWLLKQGVAPAMLPGREELEACRQWSGRDVALEVLASFRGMEGCCGTGRCLKSVEECRAYRLEQQRRCVFKAPWSGSGKGLLWCYSDFSAAVAGWCAKVLAAQGGLIGMPIYNKVGDFAMEFEVTDERKVCFIGYSRFETNGKGAYEGNHLQSDADIEQWLATWVGVDVLKRIRTHLLQELQKKFAGYRGVMGVDMMICRTDEGSYTVCPCVEVNLRMNMGIVAHTLYQRILSPEVTGRFSVEAFASAEALLKAHQAAGEAFPAVVRNGRLVSGYLSLVPVTPQSHYRAYIQVDTAKK